MTGRARDGPTRQTGQRRLLETPGLLQAIHPEFHISDNIERKNSPENIKHLYLNTQQIFEEKQHALIFEHDVTLIKRHFRIKNTTYLFYHKTNKFTKSLSLLINECNLWLYFA